MKKYFYFLLLVGMMVHLPVMPVNSQQNGIFLPPPLKRNQAGGAVIAKEAGEQTVPIEQNATVEENTLTAAQPSDTEQNALAPQISQSRITMFEDWVHRCTDIVLDGQSVTQCELLQAQQRAQNDKFLNILIMAFAEVLSQSTPPKREFMLTSVVPLDVFLPDGMRFLADGGEVLHIPFRNCNPNGCWSQMIVEDEALNALKKGRDGLARFTVMNGQEVEVKFSLQGLTAGLNALQQGDASQPEDSNPGEDNGQES